MVESGGEILYSPNHWVRVGSFYFITVLLDLMPAVNNHWVNLLGSLIIFEICEKRLYLKSLIFENFESYLLNKAIVSFGRKPSPFLVASPVTYFLGNVFPSKFRTRNFKEAHFFLLISSVT